MKKYLFLLVAAAVLFGISVALGFLITLIRYVAEKPVAEVEVIKICQSEGGESYFGGYFAGDEFANVKILKIYDFAEFKKAAHKISKDGQRANLPFSDGSLSCNPPKCYKVDSLRNRGLSSWWHNFGYNWKMAIGYVFPVLITLCCVACFIITKKQ
ncbi:MAG: hypothetical protein J6W96_03000 [Alphaproteobacteria bacterium]|nr:hypothetical protein [Alphaproteobacteria bacterium]